MNRLNQLLLSVILICVLAIALSLGPIGNLGSGFIHQSYAQVHALHTVSRCQPPDCGGPPAAGTDWVSPRWDSDRLGNLGGDLAVQVFVLNIGPGSVKATVYFYDETGAVLKKKPLSIPPRFTEEAFFNVDPGPDFGWIEVIGSGPVVPSGQNIRLDVFKVNSADANVHRNWSMRTLPFFDVSKLP